MACWAGARDFDRAVIGQNMLGPPPAMFQDLRSRAWGLLDEHRTDPYNETARALDLFKIRAPGPRECTRRAGVPANKLRGPPRLARFVETMRAVRATFQVGAGKGNARETHVSGFRRLPFNVAEPTFKYGGIVVRRRNVSSPLFGQAGVGQRVGAARAPILGANEILKER